MSEDTFKEVNDKLGVADFNAEIVDNKFIITPANNGVILLASLSNQQSTIEVLEKEVVNCHNEMQLLIEENEDFRELLLNCIDILTDSKVDNSDALIQDINDKLWRVVGVLADGTEINIDMKEEINE